VLGTTVAHLATGDDRVNPLLSSRVVGETFRTGNDLQEQALYGGPFDDPAATVPGEFAVTSDGLSWARG
jgi:halogenation protein CepH